MKDSADLPLAAQQREPNKTLPSELRVLLWDIDGTLLQSTRPGSFRKYFAPAMEKVYGTSGKISEVSAAGATDAQIVFHALRDDGFSVEQVAARMTEFVDAMCDEMNNFLEFHQENYEILPGVKEILQATAANPLFVNALLTGNVRCGAEIKCRAVDVWQYFENSLNTYGDVSHDRRQLAVTAGKNFDEHYQYEFLPEQFIIIGDTPFDIATAQHFGAKIVSVETGRGIDPAKLATERPDFQIKDLRDTQKVLEILESL